MGLPSSPPLDALSPRRSAAPPPAPTRQTPSTRCWWRTARSQWTSERALPLLPCQTPHTPTASVLCRRGCGVRGGLFVLLDCTLYHPAYCVVPPAPPACAGGTLVLRPFPTSVGSRPPTLVPAWSASGGVRILRAKK